MRTRRVQVGLRVIPDWVMRQGGGHPIGKVVEVSPVGVEIVAESHKGRHFFFPWSNVTGVEYLDDAPAWTTSWTPATTSTSTPSLGGSKPGSSTSDDAS